MKTVSPGQDRTGIERETAGELALPPSVQAALGELVNAAKDGLLALSVGVGLGVLHELMETEVDDVVGPKSQHDTERTAVRHGHEAGEVTLGGRRVGVQRPRVRTADDSEEVPLNTYEHFASRDPLSRLVLEQMLAGVSTRRLRRTREPVGVEVTAVERSVSKSAVSRAFVAKTGENLELLMSRSLADVRLAVLMIDGIDLKGRTNVVALGITTDGVKTPLGLWEGSSENAAVATALLADLVARGLDVEQGVLCVLDGSKALRRAVRDVLGTHTPVQRCVRHYPDLRVMPTWCADRLGGGRIGPVGVGIISTPSATSSTGSQATWRCAGPRPGCSKPSASSAA
jgi:transposase-like protein